MTTIPGDGYETEHAAELGKRRICSWLTGWLPVRFVVAGLTFCGVSIISCHKFDLSIAIVAMVNQTAVVTTTFNDSSSESCEHLKPLSSNNSLHLPLEEVTNNGSFTWSGSTQGLILGAYFYGAIVPLILGGRLAERYNATIIFGFGVFLSAILCSMTPFIAQIGAAPLIALRVIIGLVHGLSLPATVAIVARWAPQDERSTFMALIYSGRYLGIVYAMLLFGYLCATGVAGGWPFAFYISGSMGFLWAVVWFLLVYNEPSQHPRISKLELQKIRKDVVASPQKKLSAPWKSIFTSVPFWALVAARFSNMWLSMLLFTKLPSYMEAVLRFPIRQNGQLSALVFACTIVSMMSSGITADWLRKQGLHINFIRKVFQTTASVAPAACLVAISLSGCDRWTVLVFLVLAKTFLGAFTGGNVPAVVDMAPKYSATLNGILSTFGQSTGVLAPLVAGLIIDYHESTERQWKTVFYLTAGISAAGGFIFAAFGSAEKQPWADEEESTFTKGRNSFQDHSGQFKKVVLHANADPSALCDADNSPSPIKSKTLPCDKNLSDAESKCSVSCEQQPMLPSSDRSAANVV